MASITFKDGTKCLFSDADAELVSAYRWMKLSKNMQQRVIEYAYARSKSASGKKTIIYMHALIIKPKSGLHVDHLNGNGLDNRRSNLRIASRSQNAQRRHARCSKTGLLGVVESFGKWNAQIGKDRKKFYIGRFNTPEAAAIAYDIKAEELYGEHAMKNNVVIK